MSCGSKACTIIETPRYFEAAKQRWTLLRVWRLLGVVIDKHCRHQVWLELEKARQRGLLKHLEDHQLRDIGLTREQAHREARKPFWK